VASWYPGNRKAIASSFCRVYYISHDGVLGWKQPDKRLRVKDSISPAPGHI
jgi:hypothetical protein